MTIHSRSVIASLSSSSPSSRPGTAFSSVSLSPGDATFAVASGKDVLHVLRLNLDRNAAESKRLEEIRSVRISQVRRLFLTRPLWSKYILIFLIYHSISNRQYKHQTLVEEVKIHIHTCGMRCGLRELLLGHPRLLFQLQVGGEGSTSM